MKKVLTIVLLLTACGSSPSPSPQKTETPDNCPEVTGTWSFNYKATSDECDLGDFSDIINYDGTSSVTLEEVCGPDALDFSLSSEEDTSTCEITSYAKCTYYDREFEDFIKMTLINDKLVKGTKELHIFDAAGSCTTVYEIVGNKR